MEWRLDAASRAWLQSGSHGEHSELVALVNCQDLQQCQPAQSIRTLLQIMQTRDRELLERPELTEAAIETLGVLAEARMDEDVLTGAEIEAMVSGRSAADCDEAAGATRIKRLRDALGSQIVGELLVRNVARKGYVLSVAKKVLRIS